MLENEPLDSNNEGHGVQDGATTPAGDAAETTTPVRRTRAPRRKAAAAAEPAAASEASVPSADETEAEAAPAPPARRRRKAAAPAAQPALVDEAPEAPAEEPVAPVKATRSRRKKAAAPAVAEIPEPQVEETAVEEEPVEEEPAQPDLFTAQTTTPIVGILPLDEEFVEEEPAPRTRSRRAPALPPAVLFMPPEQDAEPPAPTRRTRRTAAAPATGPVGVPEPIVAEAAVPVPAPVEAPAAAEEEPAEGPRTSRRRRRSGAAEPVAPVEPVLEEADETADDVEEGAEDELEDEDSASARRRRRRGRRGRGRGKGPLEDGEEGDEEPLAATGEPAAEAEAEPEDDEESEDGDGVTRRRRRRRRKGSGDTETGGIEDGVHTVVRVREPRTRTTSNADEVQGVSGSTRLEAKRQRRRDGREQRRTRPPILSESEFLARREAVDRVMVVRQKPDRTQIAVLEDGVLVEHYVSRTTSGTMVGNVYLGKVQNVLPSMEAAFVDVGRGRNAVLYAGEVNWDATGLEGRARSIETALRSGDSVLVQVTKDPLGHKGARLSSHIALSGRHLVYVPNGNASGISRKLPDTERKRLRDVLKKLVPDGAGVIVRTAAEGASEDELARDVKRLQGQWEDIQARAAEGHAPAALSEEPDLVIRVVRDLFNEDFREVVIQGEQAYGEVERYLDSVSPELLDRLHRYTGTADIFADKRIDEQILKGLDRKVFLPSGGHLVIDRTEAMTVVDVNTGKYTGAGGNLEETVTRNNLEAAEEIVRQLRLRDIGGIVVIDFIDMVLESNRELVLRRLTECLGRDRTKHQVTEITSLGLVQMTRKRIGAGLLEAFTETCEHCKGRGLIIHSEPVPEKRVPGAATQQVKAVAAAPVRTETPPPPSKASRRRRGGNAVEQAAAEAIAATSEVEDIEPLEIPEPMTEPVPSDETGPAAVTAGLPPAAGSGVVKPAGSGVVTAAPKPTGGVTEDGYDISGYDLSRYDSGTTNGGSHPAADAEPLQLTGADDPDAAEEDEDDDSDESVGAGAGRRRSRRGGAKRRTRP